MTREQQDAIERVVNQRCDSLLAADNGTSDFRRYLINSVVRAYLVGVTRIQVEETETPEQVARALADALGFILADAADKTTDVRNPELMKQFMWRMSGLIGAQFSHAAGLFAAQRERSAPPDTH